MIIVPHHLVIAQLARSQAHAEVLEQYGEGAAEALRGINMIIQMLQRLLADAEASADDLLTLDEAMEWSGLTADALRKRRQRDGLHAGGRWRRGDLPIRDPFAAGRPSLVGRDTSQAPVRTAGSESDLERLARAVADARAA